MSETKRSAANQWFANTLLSRLDDKRTGAIVVVMQRVHMDDLTGFLLSQSDEWEVLSLPAIAEFDGDRSASETDARIAAKSARRCRPSASRFMSWKL